MLKIKTDEVEKIIQDVADSIIVPRFQHPENQEIHFKSEDNPVTIADKEAEKALKERLSALLPGSKVVGEEEFEDNPAIIQRFLSESPVWIVDPLDGTKQFIAGEPLYGVIVALAQGDQTVAGWLYDPTSREFVTTELGAGTYHKGERQKVIEPDDLPNMRGIIGYRIMCAYRDCEESDDARKPIFVPMNSACHDYASLVVGKEHFSRRTQQAHFHTWLQTCTPWDSSAGILAHTEAGGYTAHWNGDPFQPSHYGRGILSAGSKESWEEIRNWISTFCCVEDEAA
ncbi:MAG: inositol monophosphatase [Alphaproteobacteria bacterium]|jgi:fructose-1,6-bisphosphatase/inositol monophosphatase family enzyme|nr:inositol monophosphatase [Alphaproteobacteria bacterium]